MGWCKADLEVVGKEGKVTCSLTMLSAASPCMQRYTLQTSYYTVYTLNTSHYTLHTTHFTLHTRKYTLHTRHL